MAEELRPGAMLRHNTYRIERMLGQGGFGITYLAYDLNLDRKVAIKEFFPKDFCARQGDTSHVTTATQSAHDVFERYKVKFLKEARNIAKFDHPGIIKIHAAFEENDTAYYVMDFIDGVSLSDMVEQYGPMSPEEAVGYIRGVAEALEYVHSRRINHLDIKPANIMVRRVDCRPVLIDFGLAKQYDKDGHQTSTTPTGLSHGYAPIEQYTVGGVQQFSPQTDLYSLAATLFFLISGQVPPQASVLVEQGLLFPDRIPMSMRIPLATAMSSARGQRQPSVKAFIKDLTMTPKDDSTQILDAVVVEPSPTPAPVPPVVPVIPVPTPVPAPPVVPPNRRPFPWLYVGLGGGVLGALVAVLIMFLPAKTEQTPNPQPAEQAVVTDMAWMVDGAAARYSGTVDDNRQPDGEGEFTIISGDSKGDKYHGGFAHGKLDGHGVYTFKNGDMFDGEISANEFRKGTYTVKKTGEYFKGSFSEDSPADGVWYKADGTPQ